METSTILRAARRAAGQTQRSFAAASHASQPSIAVLESRGQDATVDRLDRLLASTGAQVAALPTSAPTIGTWADRIGELLAVGDEASARTAFVRIHDRLRDEPPAERVALCVFPPPTTGDARYDAAIAALVDHLLTSDDLPVPRWVAKVPAAAEPFYLTPNRAIRSHVEATTPERFRRWNVFVASAFFDSI